MTLLTGILMLFSALLSGQTMAPDIKGGSLQGNSREVRATRAGTSEPRRSHDVLRLEAQAASQNAAALRDKQTRADLAAAIRLFRESARLFEAAQLHDDAADAHLRVAEIYLTISRYNQARRASRQALKLTQNPELRCAAVSRIARSYANIGPSSLADSYSKQALAMCESLSEKAQAEAQGARGETLELAGEHASSLDYLTRARDLFKAVRNDDGEAQALLMLAYALFAEGRRAEGLDSARNALRLWSSSAANRSGIAHVRFALGAFAITMGEFETAQCNYRLARPLYDEIGSKDDVATTLNSMGWVNRELGDWQKSLEFYRTARAAFASLGDLLGEQQAVEGEGMALSGMKQYERLLPLYQTELRLAREAHDPVLVASSLRDMAGAYEIEHNYAKAEALYRRALAACRDADHLYVEGDILIRLGRLQAKQGRYSQAIDSLEQAKKVREKTAQVEEIAKVQYELADVYRHMNRLEDARTAIEKTIEIIEAQRVSIANFDSRASYFASVHRYYALYIQVLMLLHRQDPQRGLAQKAFDASERSKVRSLLDLLTASSQEAPCDELLQRQLASMDEEVAHEADAKPSSTRDAPTLTLEQVQAEIQDSGTILLEYALGDQKSYVWAIDQNHIVAHELPRAEKIAELVKKFRETLVPTKLANGESTTAYQARVRKLREEYAPTGRQLSRLLLASVPLGGAKRILIVPDGSLQFMPFAALPPPDSSDSATVLVSRHEIAVLPSASALATLRRAAAKRTPPTAVAAIFADPIFEEDDPRIKSIAAQGKPQQQAKALPSLRGPTGNYIPRLPASRDEANAIAALLGTRDSKLVHIALDFDANRETVLKNGLSGFRFVHFATHGIIDAQHPEMSALILSLVNRRGKRQDGYLRLGDIYQLKLSADLVVLSSCESALGKDLESEGIIGLPRGFLYAGAKSVIASLWKVDDAAAAKLMTSLYRRVSGGESPSSALRSAQVEMAHDEQWANPSYWAAFVLEGDYR